MTDIRQLREFYKTARCSKCNTIRRYENPLERCYECREKFCYDHIVCGQFNSSMRNNDAVRDLCRECQSKYNYKSLQ